MDGCSFVLAEGEILAAVIGSRFVPLCEYLCVCVCVWLSVLQCFSPHSAFVTTQPKRAQNNLAESSIRLLDTRNEIIARLPGIIDPQPAVNINEVPLHKDKYGFRVLWRTPRTQTHSSF